MTLSHVLIALAVVLGFLAGAVALAWLAWRKGRWLIARWVLRAVLGPLGLVAESGVRSAVAAATKPPTAAALAGRDASGHFVGRKASRNRRIFAYGRVIAAFAFSLLRKAKRR